MNKVLVIGENCIDVFVYGSSKRKSPEGDGAVFLPQREVYADGMAYNTTNNLTSMGVDVDVITNQEEITKRRYVDVETNQLYLRVDENDNVRRYDVSNLPKLNEYSAILISDYDKGFLTNEDIQHISQKHPLVILDTKKQLGEWCRDIRFIKINRSEFLNNADNIIDKSWLDEKLLITLDKDGTIHKGIRYPAEEAEVVDICGAGDTFIAGFTKEYISTNDVSQSILYANKVAGMVVGKQGVVTPF